MFFQQESGKLLADQNRHILPLTKRHQLVLALPVKHPLKGCLRPLSPARTHRIHLAIHGLPPSCESARPPKTAASLPENRGRRNGNAPTENSPVDVPLIPGYILN
jgi:hypothetical protein